MISRILHTFITRGKTTNLHVDCSRWTLLHTANLFIKVATPATPAGETSTVWEVIERRKREKAELEEAVSRKEAVAHREREEVTHKPRHMVVGDVF